MPRSQTRDNQKKKRKFAAQRKKRELEAQKRGNDTRGARSTKNQRDRRPE